MNAIGIARRVRQAEVARPPQDGAARPAADVAARQHQRRRRKASGSTACCTASTPGFSNLARFKPARVRPRCTSKARAMPDGAGAHARAARGCPSSSARTRRGCCSAFRYENVARAAVGGRLQVQPDVPVPVPVPRHRHGAPRRREVRRAARDARGRSASRRPSHRRDKRASLRRAGDPASRRAWPSRRARPRRIRASTHHHLPRTAHDPRLHTRTCRRSRRSCARGRALSACAARHRTRCRAASSFRISRRPDPAGSIAAGTGSTAQLLVSRFPPVAVVHRASATPSADARDRCPHESLQRLLRRTLRRPLALAAISAGCGRR